MPDKKLTDNEIIKALECCSKAANFNDCEKLQCPLYRECKIGHKSMEETIIPYALDLINRQKAEIERLTYELECLLCHATGNKLSEHTYPLGTMENCVDEYIDECCEEAKAEAYKEFAERLKAKSVSLYKNGEEIVSAIPITKEDVDNLVKEMVGED